MRPVSHLILISLLIALSEVLTLFSGPKVGIVAYISILFLLIIQFTFIKDLSSDFTRLFQVMTLIPLYRIITLSIPVELITYVGYLIITTVSLLVGSLILIAVLGISLEEVGIVLRDPLPQILCIIAAPCIGYIEWILLKPSGLEAVIPATLILMLAAFTEELIFRGIIQQSIEKAVGSAFSAILLTTTLYTIFFISYASGLELLLVAFTSLLFGYVVSRSGSIAGVSLSHAFINISFLVIFPLQM
ncbi:MAG: CAAX amino terminal protease self- immunity [Candidatus Syntrophoarchaeum sp. GoM_oil]|nr:MAG: CAAX amino terminal protease self- immunity [Candidatus Syntrophoarchaeum sp. GoM_oil]